MCCSWSPADFSAGRRLIHLLVLMQMRAVACLAIMAATYVTATIDAPGFSKRKSRVTEVPSRLGAHAHP
jgi:hypothetical protein